MPRSDAGLDAQDATEEPDAPRRARAPEATAAGTGGPWARWLLGAATAAAVYAGWRTFWFLTDDAYIAFRYVSNSMAGHGYVWNPPPFQAVEGYTSFLWVVILDGAWRLTGVEPPAAANWLALLFGYATLAVIARLFLRMRLPPEMESVRLPMLALALLGVVTNRTFLAWLSSGLETSLFNFCLTTWIYVGLTDPARRSPRWAGAFSAFATLTALTRPDGVLMVAATGVALLGYATGPPARSLRARLRSLAWGLPLLAVPLHFLWRFSVYGKWLPNTYYAKHVSPWPESGARYLGAFVLEYGLWLWLGLLVAWWARELLRGGPRAAPRSPRSVWHLLDARLLTAAAILGQLGYYTFIVGGDHFEWRIYSYVIPLLFVSSAWLAARLARRPRVAVALVVAFLVVSWPIPWVHWSQTHDRSLRGETRRMVAPIADYFPPGTRAPVRAWDELQRWLITHYVGNRHQEHKIFHEVELRRQPVRGSVDLRWEDRNVYADNSVGVVGWSLPTAAIIDKLGLNDPIIAHSTQGLANRRRKMAHDRRPPEFYVECYKPNITIKKQQVVRIARTLTDAEIQACQLLRW